MAFGEHWEWRGFGEFQGLARRRIEALPRKFPDHQEITDEYLHAPGATVNIKVREGYLKFKRLTGMTAGLERWLEDPSENHLFPVAREVIAKLFVDLGLREMALPELVADKESLLELVRQADPRMALVRVRKKRWQHQWLEKPRGGGREGVIVELAEISVPERVTSVSLEHPEAELVTAAREALGLPAGLRELSYLRAIAAWARGEWVGEGR
jgi:hypothetical protein